jgi:hypothetical protein
MLEANSRRDGREVRFSATVYADKTHFVRRAGDLLHSVAMYGVVGWAGVPLRLRRIVIALEANEVVGAISTRSGRVEAYRARPPPDTFAIRDHELVREILPTAAHRSKSE